MVDHVQSTRTSHQAQALLPGQAERRTHDYQRHGTTSLFAALEIATGSVIGKCWPRPRALEALPPVLPSAVLCSRGMPALHPACVFTPKLNSSAFSKLDPRNDPVAYPAA
ncbi:MAG: hypothetical protein DMG86_13045 [Acidobacteria bacterium]|nr:MAG: hypothetical protein DMG86_13045 [Acidobacteriota bacterium]